MQNLLTMNLLKAFYELFYPSVCIHSGDHLAGDESILSTKCLFNLPFFENNDFRDNEISELFKGRIPIELACSYLYFRKGNVTQSLVHHLKYHGRQDIGTLIGKWMSELIKTNDDFLDIDTIIPVPLHSKKERKRGYNQLTKFGKELSTNLNIPFNKSVLKRRIASKTQTSKSRLERFEQNNTKFYINEDKSLENKHILLIDDVLTTGATLESCAKQLLKIKGLKISVLTIAYVGSNI